MTDYTPTTEIVRTIYAMRHPDDEFLRGQDFDRWLAEHEARLIEKVEPQIRSDEREQAGQRVFAKSEAAKNHATVDEMIAYHAGSYNNYYAPCTRDCHHTTRAIRAARGEDTK